MASYFFSPVGNSSQITATGAPLNGGTITTFQAGTNTPLATYTDNVGSNPSVSLTLNTLGLPSSPVWLLGGQAVKFVIKDSLGNLIRTLDVIPGINDVRNLAYAGVANASGTGVLPTSAFGKLTYLLTTTGTQTLPAASAASPGSAISLYAVDVNFTIARAGADLIYVNGVSMATSFGLALGEAVTLVSDGVNQWFAAANAQRALGSGQTWQNLTASRSLVTTFTNSTGRVILVAVTINSVAAGSFALSPTISGVAQPGSIANAAGAGYQVKDTLLIPAGGTYSVASGGSGGGTLGSWYELR